MPKYTGTKKIGLPRSIQSLVLKSHISKNCLKAKLCLTFFVFSLFLTCFKPSCPVYSTYPKCSSLLPCQNKITIFPFLPLNPFAHFSFLLFTLCYVPSYLFKTQPYPNILHSFFPLPPEKWAKCNKKRKSLPIICLFAKSSISIRA